MLSSLRCLRAAARLDVAPQNSNHSVLRLRRSLHTANGLSCKADDVSSSISPATPESSAKTLGWSPKIQSKNLPPRSLPVERHASPSEEPSLFSTDNQVKRTENEALTRQPTAAASDSLENVETRVAQAPTGLGASDGGNEALISTSHMEGVIQRIAYHLLFRPTTAKTTGKLPIQVATLGPTHAFNSMAAIAQIALDSHAREEAESQAPTHSGPPRTIVMLVPTEAYKFQCEENMKKAKVPLSRHWTILTEDEFWNSIFPGYSNLMTPYMEPTGAVVLPTGPASEKFCHQTLLQTSSAHATTLWSQGLQQNAEQHLIKSQELSDRYHYCRYSPRELAMAILSPPTAFDERFQLLRLHHLVRALKASFITDIIPFNTSVETLSLLATVHGLTGKFPLDYTLPNFLSSYHQDIPVSSSTPPKRVDWMPNMSFALDFVDYSNVHIPYLALSNDNIDRPEWEEKALTYIGKSTDGRSKTAPYDFWQGAKSNPLLLLRAAKTDPFPLLHAPTKTTFKHTAHKAAQTSALLPIDKALSTISHLELKRDEIVDALPTLLAAASHALAARDTQAMPLRILCDNNMDLIAIQNLLEMHHFPTVSQSLFATPAVRLVCDLFAILIELSKQSVRFRAKELAEAKKKEETSRKESIPESEPSRTESPSQEAILSEQKGEISSISTTSTVSESTPSPVTDAKQQKKKQAMMERLLDDNEQGQLNLAAAFHSLLQGTYGFDTKAARQVESRLMFQNLKYKDPIMSLLLGMATGAKYMHLNPREARKRRTVGTSGQKSLVDEERDAMMEEEFDGSIALATEDAHMMIGMLNSPSTPFRTKALASEVLRLQQALAQQDQRLSPTSQFSDKHAQTIAALSASLSEKSPESSTTFITSADQTHGITTSHHKKHSPRHHKPSHKHASTRADIRDAVYSESLDARASQGAKYLYQDLAYLIGAIRAMALSPAEIVELFVARHEYRNRITASSGSDKAHSAASSSSTLSEENLVVIKAFAKSLKEMTHEPSFQSLSNGSATPSSTDPSEVLPENYVSNARFLQRALEFVKYGYVEIPNEAFQLSAARARATPDTTGVCSYRYPILLNLEHFASGSGDFAITLRVLADPTSTLPPQPQLLPPPPLFTSQLMLYSTGQQLQADRPPGNPDWKADYDALKLRRLFSSSLLYAFSTNIHKHPTATTELYAMDKQSFKLETFLQRMEKVIEVPNSVSSLAFQEHAINNPSEEQIESYFALPEGTLPTTPRIGSTLEKSYDEWATRNALQQQQESSSENNNNNNNMEQSKEAEATSNVTNKYLDYRSHPAMKALDKAKKRLLTSPSANFVAFEAFRPRQFGASSIRHFRDCQLAFAYRYVWIVEPGKPASIHITTGNALHEAASKVHAHLLDKLSAALRAASVPPSPTPPEASDIHLLPTESEPTTPLIEAHTADEIEKVEIAPELQVSPQDVQHVHETLIEEAFKTELMESQSLTQEEAAELLAKPKYRQHVERAKAATLWQWEKEREKQEAIGMKVIKLEKEKSEKKKLLLQAKEALKKKEAKKQAVAQDAALESLRQSAISEASPGLVGKTLSHAAEVSSSTPETPEAVVLPGAEDLLPPSAPAEAVLDHLGIDSTSTMESWSKLSDEKHEKLIEELEEELAKHDSGASNDPTLQRYSFSEHEFSFSLPTGHVWRGAWDRVDIDPETGEVEITEYKTSLKKNRESGLFQLQTYALAYWKVHHVIPSKLVLSSLANSDKDEYRPTKLDLIRTENLILATLRRMADGVYVPTARPSQCKACPFSQQCPSSLVASPLYVPARAEKAKIQANAEDSMAFDDLKVLSPSPTTPMHTRDDHHHKSKKKPKKTKSHGRPGQGFHIALPKDNLSPL